MEFVITDKAKEKLNYMKEKNIPIMLASFPVGWVQVRYAIVSGRRLENDNVYNVDGIEIIVPHQIEKDIKGAKIDFKGIIFKDFLVQAIYK